MKHFRNNLYIPVPFLEDHTTPREGTVMFHSLPVVRVLSLPITILQQSGTFVLCDEPTLTRQGHQPHGLHQDPSDGSGEMCDTAHNCRITRGSFSAPKILCAPPTHLCLHLTPANTNFFLIIPQFCQNFLARSFQVGFSYPRAYIIFFKSRHTNPKPFRADVVVWEGTHNLGSGTDLTALDKSLSLPESWFLIC